MIKHALEHFRVALSRYKLVGVRKITIIVVRASRDPRGDSRRKFRKIKAPLLTRIPSKKFLTKVLSDAIENHVFAGLNGDLGDADPLECVVARTSSRLSP